jgi:hypothetical protein
MGHFVVLCGMERQATCWWPIRTRTTRSATTCYYQVPVGRLINAIMLGIVTYDANLLIISKKDCPA